MVRIILDTFLLLKINEEIIEIQDYPTGYFQVLNSLRNQQDLKIVIRKPVLHQWFKNMSLRYPQGSFTFETLDSRKALAHKWNIPLPDELLNEEILGCGLLTLDLRPQPGQSFEDLLLAHFYNPLFSAKTFPFTQLPQLFASFDAIRWQANRANPLLARILHQRIESWKEKARSFEQRQVIEWFAANPLELHKLLLQFRVLRAYPALGETLLGSKYAILAALKLQLVDLAVDENLIPETVAQVTYLLNAQLPQTAEGLNSFIEQISGLLWVEFETLEKLLLAHPDWISPAVIDLMDNKFESISRRTTKRLVELRSQIRPSKPQTPNGNWGVPEMLEWATGSYLPYQAWCSAREQFDKDLYNQGDRFSEWLLSHWHDIHANSERMVFNILPQIAAGLNDQGRIHLVLVVDNLGWSFAEMLRELFQEKDLYLLEAEPYLAMLPTETETSKKCLLSGAVGYTAIDNNTYKGILETGWLPYAQSNSFRYISDIGKLKQVNSLDARAYVVNYLAVDKALHKSKDEIGMSHRKHVHYLLRELVENVSAFIDKHALGDRIRIHVVSDHGSTQIPAELQNDLNVEFFKQAGFTIRSHRYLEVSNERFNGLADNLKLDCFFLPANDFYLPTNMLCARRANRFLPTSNDVFVHGGVLPEEVIVPYMTFEPATVALKDLDVILIKNLFRYRPESVELKIGNPNDAAVEHIQISALNGNVEWGLFEPVVLLNGHHDTARQVTTRFKLTSLPEEQTSLSLRVRFRSRGEAHTFDVKLPIVMRKMVEEKNTSVFDD